MAKLSTLYDIPKLGFGAMRLPRTDSGEMDLEQVKEMVDIFLDRGFTYFDTAYVYNDSEVTLREALVKRHPRDAFQIATKMPLWAVNSAEDYEKRFQESLERLGVDYIDFYLLHNLSGDRIDVTEELGGWDYMKSLKADGRARHIGFSFHDSPERLDEILTKHPECEFVQLQINYADWEDSKIQSRRCYEVARKHNKPIIIMEPVKGGSLASMSPEIREIFEAANPNASVPSWAVRYCASLEGVVTVLSGMSNTEQVLDNTGYMSKFEPLTDSEQKTIDKVVEALRSIPTIPCTSCRYCVDDCPQNINIPGIIDTLNNYTLFDNLDGSKRSYGFVSSRGGKASDCIECASCEDRCPQQIEIMAAMKKATGLFE
ncbi:MAG: aldo/keto reductase [Eubacteriales bacterium]|jgi:predicted aldo/keto reductase-like oxidoreductase